MSQLQNKKEDKSIKKDNKDGPGKKKNKKSGNFNKDAYERMNFLHQASRLNLALNPENEELTRYYMKCFRSVKQKKCLKWSRDLKRSICSGCNMLQTPGVTTRVRVNDHKRIVMTCLSCNSVKRAHIRQTKRNTVGKSKRRTKKRKKERNKK